MGAMFESLSERLTGAFRSITGRGRISERNVADVMEKIREALLEADVSFAVAKKFCEDCRQKAMGAEVVKTLSPDQVMIRIVHDELVALMGPVDTAIPYVSSGPTIILMAGLQGSGKTTTCGKLARKIQSEGKLPLMVACDLKRPAAIDQLETLGTQLNVPVYAQRDTQDVPAVAMAGIRRARELGRNVVILDSAGRLAIDDELMDEIARVAQVTEPHQIYLVVDAMTGQDAVNTARAFNDRLELDGVILTKFDSDTRGGAALSVKATCGKPIKFIGTGEKLDKLEAFRPEGIASRILGMGDVVELVRRAEENVDQEKAARLQEKMARGTFDLNDFMAQIDQMQRMGSFRDLLKLIPGAGAMLKQMDQSQFDDAEIRRMKAIVQSMTPDERARPEIVDASRRRRIAKGSGMQPADVSGLVKNFDSARDMMKAMSGMGMMDRMKLGSALTRHSLATGEMPRLNMSKVQAQQTRQLSAKERERLRAKKRKGK